MAVQAGGETATLASRLQEHLKERGVASDTVTLKKIGGGASRETWLVQVGSAGSERTLVLRKDAEDGSTVPTPLEHEYVVLRDLAAQGVRVPEPLWYEDEDGHLGVPFYLRKGYEGTSDQRKFSGASAENLSREIAQALAHLHSVDPTKVAIPGLEVPATVDDAIAAEIERWASRLREPQVEPAPHLHEIAWWLRRHRPAVSARPAVVWGDVGVANSICSPDGELLAMSDFELATYGDPLRDVASALWRGVGALAGRDNFISFYEEATGRPVSQERLDYYDVFFNWQVGLFIHTAASGEGEQGRMNLHPSLLKVWAYRMNMHKAMRRMGL